MVDTAIYIGRFEPVHNGHMALLQRALDSAQQVIVVVGSAWQARSPKNPFTWPEREAMLRNALPEADRSRMVVLPMRDYYNEAVWVQAVRQGVARLTTPGARIGLVGHFKDATSGYLSAFPGWELIHMERQGPIDATAIRDAWFGATPDTVQSTLTPLADQMPASTLATLTEFAHTQHYLALQQEWQMLRGYRQAWATAPYPPVFVTVDAVLRCQDHVLLIRRAHAPGKGQLAVPGGFIEQRETVWQSCLRELVEETHCHLPEATMRAALQSVAVFDHPDRSQRGRTITHAHYFDLGDAQFPVVQADDDATLVQWTRIDQLAGMEEEFFEDHFHMLDHFLGLTGLKAPVTPQSNQKVTAQCFVSPSFTDEKLDSPSFSDLVDLFEDRLSKWLIEPASELLTTEHGGVAAVALSLNYFEGIEIYLSGVDSKHNSKAFFRKGFQRIFSVDAAGSHIFDQVVDELYTYARCGFAHEGLFRNRVFISEVWPEAFHVTWPRKDGVLVKDAKLETVVINPKKFIDGIRQHFASYTQELRNESDPELKGKFLAAVDLKWGLNEEARVIAVRVVGPPHATD